MNEQRLSIGMSVVTTRDAGAMDWREGARPNVRWGVRGIVVAVHDSHGLVYDVKHEDGSRAPYEPSELDNVSVAVDNEKPAEDPKRRDYRDGKLRDLLIEAGVDMTDDAILAGVHGLVSDRKALMDANGELAEECRRLTPIEAEVRVLREQLDFMRDLVKTAIVQAGIAEQAREQQHERALVSRVFGEIRRADGRLDHVEFEHRADGRWVPKTAFALTTDDRLYLAIATEHGSETLLRDHEPAASMELPKGYHVDYVSHKQWWTAGGPGMGSRYAYRTQDEAIAACHEHQRSTAKGSDAEPR